MSSESLHIASNHTPTPTQHSHIITLTLPKSKDFLKNIASARGNGGSSVAEPAPSSQATDLSPTSQLGGYSSNMDRDSAGSLSPITSPESSATISESPPSSPLRRSQKPQNLNEIRFEAAREAVQTFVSWGREAIVAELDEAVAIRDALGIGAEILQMASWVKECLRYRYKVWIQCSEAYTNEVASRSTRGNKDHDFKIACGYPGCGRAWNDGEIRVSFEPLGWTMVGKAKTFNKKKVTFDLDDITEENEEEDSIVNKKNREDDSNKGAASLPDYYAWYTNPRQINLHGQGGFFCLHCFENLLAPSSTRPIPGNKRKREENKEYLRPSPLCRIYASVFAEDRVSADGKFQLDAESEDIVIRWKDALFDKGMKNMRDRFGDLLGNTAEDSMEVDDQEVGGGRGLAELLGRGEEEFGKSTKKQKCG